MLAAFGLPIRRRIVHVHNADEAVLTPNRLKALLYREPARRVCLALADRIVGISNHTLDTFLARRSRRSGRDIVHYYGVDETPFENAASDRAAFRGQLQLSADTPIMLFAGRLVPEKNPVFAVEVLAEVRRFEPRAVAVFAGAGSEERAVLERAQQLGVTDAIRMLGWRDNLADVMCCCDLFILPRPEQPMEGFGIAVAEAQLAGLRLLLSRGIADDPLVADGGLSPPRLGFRRGRMGERGDGAVAQTRARTGCGACRASALALRYGCCPAQSAKSAWRG